MGPFHIPWSTFGAVFCLLAAIILALIWVARDLARERREARAGEERRS